MVSRRSPRVIRRIRSAVDALRVDGVTPQDAATDDVGDLIGTIGTSLLEASQATSDVESDLRTVAAAYGRADMHLAVLPTVVLVGERTRTSVYSDVGAPLRLDQVAALEQEARRAARDRPEPSEVIARVRAIRGAPPRVPAVAGRPVCRTGPTRTGLRAPR